jgi:hypothetical protein
MVGATPPTVGLEVLGEVRSVAVVHRHVRRVLLSARDAKPELRVGATPLRSGEQPGSIDCSTRVGVASAGLLLGAEAVS